MAAWERQAGESYQAYEAFNKYLKVTPRSYPKVAAELRKNVSLIKRWARKYDWRARADAWDAEISRKAMEKASADYAEMIERQIKIGQMFQVRGATAIQHMDMTNLPPKFIPALTEMTKIGANMERSARELKAEKPKENIFVETLTKLWRKEEDD